MKPPNGERADLGTKLEDYTLNPFHRDGPHCVPQSNPLGLVRFLAADFVPLNLVAAHVSPLTRSAGKDRASLRRLLHAALGVRLHRPQFLFRQAGDGEG